LAWRRKSLQESLSIKECSKATASVFVLSTEFALTLLQANRDSNLYQEEGRTSTFWNPHIFEEGGRTSTFWNPHIFEEGRTSTSWNPHIFEEEEPTV
jgi:hypothetical protein